MLCGYIRISYRYPSVINLGIYTHLTDRGGKKKFKFYFLGMESWLLNSLQNSKTHLFNCYFFHENCGFFDVSEIPLNTKWFSNSDFFSKKLKLVVL